jgi:Glycosyl hydrolase family 12/Ricin-type beta-trefoil lectin domain-like
LKTRNLLKIPAIFFATILVFTGAAARMSAQTACGNGTVMNLGNANQYAFKGDEWNSSQTQCMSVTNSTALPPGNGPSFTITQANFNDTGGAPATYPSFWYGCSYGNCTQNTQLPIEMSAISNYSITSGVTVVEPSGYSNDCAYDIWFNQTPTTSGNPNGTELMIWVDHQGPPGPISGGPSWQFTSGGYTWTAYSGTGGSGNPSWNVVSYVNNSSIGAGTTAPFNLNLGQFFADAEGHGEINASWYLMDIEYGFEVWQGGQGIEGNNFWVDVAPASSGATLTTGTPYNIVNENSGSCVDDTASGTANGTAVQQWACGQGTYSTQPNQQWEFENGTASGYYYVANVNAPAETWNVTGNGTTNGSLIQTWTYAGNPNEEWKAVPLGNGYYNFVGQGSGLCLDTPSASTANGVQLQIYTCNGTAAQAFKLVTP